MVVLNGSGDLLGNAEPSKSNLINEEDETEFYEPITAGGCARSAHVELTRGLGRFESRVCPVCKLEVFPA